MLSKNKIKFINSLKKKKHRNETGLFIAEGVKLVNEILASGFRVPLLCATPEWTETTAYKSQANIKELITITQEELRRISGQSNPNQVLAVVEQPSQEIDEEKMLNELSLVLDNINDPGNLGTIIRIADWFGINNLICSRDTVDVYNPKVVQSTMGSICRVTIQYRALHEFLPKYSKTGDVIIYGSSLEGKSIFDAPLSNKGIVVMGNESHGISEELLPYINTQLYIPNFSKISGNRAESLNVSVAAGIICAEFRKYQSAIQSGKKG